MSLVFIGGALTSNPAGRLTDRIGPAAVLGWSLGLFGVAMLIAAIAPSAVWFLLAIAAGGVMYGGVNPPTNVAVAGRMGRRLGFFLSVKQSGVPLGGLFAGVILPPIAVFAGWRWALATAAGTCLLVAAATPLMRGTDVAGRGSGEHDRRPPLTRRELVALGTFGFIMSGTQWSMFAHLSLFLTEERTFSLAAAGLGLALAQGLGAVSRLMWGWLSDLPGRRLAILSVLTATSVACLIALGVGVGGPTLWLVLALAGVAIVGWNGAYYALIADRAGAAGLGRASANALVFIFAGSVVMPPLLGLVVDVSGSWLPFWIVTAALVASAGVVLRVGLRGGRYLAPRETAQ